MQIGLNVLATVGEYVFFLFSVKMLYPNMITFTAKKL